MFVYNSNDWRLLSEHRLILTCFYFKFDEKKCAVNSKRMELICRFSIIIGAYINYKLIKQLMRMIILVLALSFSKIMVLHWERCAKYSIGRQLNISNLSRTLREMKSIYNNNDRLSINANKICHWMGGFIIYIASIVQQNLKIKEKNTKPSKCFNYPIIMTSTFILLFLSTFYWCSHSIHILL